MLTKEEQKKKALQLNKKDDPPHDSSHYGKIEYWEKRYETNTKPFDWYQRFDGIKDIVTQYITNKDFNILNIGCGNSLLSEEMYNEGYKNITNVDWSQRCIDQMTSRYQDKQESFQCQDVRDMNFPNESFDAVIDKGTLDSVLCGEYSSQNSRRMLTEVSRVLKDTGFYIVITYGQEKKRRPVLDKSDYNWNLKEVYKIYKPNVNPSDWQFNIEDKDNYHYIYVCKKGDFVMSPKGYSKYRGQFTGYDKQ